MSGQGVSDAEGGQLPAGSGRARDLVGRRRPRKPAETGRVHHLGAAPAVMPVLRDDDAESPESSGNSASSETAQAAGISITSTRTAAVQLASRTRWELDRLLADIGAEMAAAAAALDFERAGRLRDELVRVQAELDRRGSAD